MTPQAARALATWFGCGLSPVAPGTVGALGALPLHLALRLLPAPLRWAAIAAVTVVGIRAAGVVAEQEGSEDPQLVVIDEVAGALIAMALVAGRGPGAEALAWVLFRAFDIAKPGPVRAAERVKPVGAGIVLDDVVAGILAGVTARLLR